MVLIQKLGEALEVPTPGALRRGLGRLVNVHIVEHIHSEEEIWYFAELCRGALQVWPRAVPHRILFVSSTPVLPSDADPDDGRDRYAKLMFDGDQFRAVVNGGREPVVVDEEINAVDDPAVIYCQARLDGQIDFGHPEWVDEFFASGWKINKDFEHTCRQCRHRIFYLAKENTWIDDTHDEQCRYGGTKLLDHVPAEICFVPPQYVFQNAGAVEAELPAWMRNLGNAVITAHQDRHHELIEHDVQRVFREKAFPFDGAFPFVDTWYLAKRGNGEVTWEETADGFTAIQTFYTKKRSSDPRAKSRRSKKRVPDALVDLPPDLFMRWERSSVFQYPEGCTVNTEGPDVVISCPLLPMMGTHDLIQWAEALPVEAHTTEDWHFVADEGPYLNPTVLRSVRERRRV